MIAILYAECDKLGGTASRLIVDEMNAMSSRGLAANTTAAFSKYRTDFVKLNNSLHLQSNLRNDDDKLTANYMMSALERCGLEDKRGTSSPPG